MSGVEGLIARAREAARGLCIAPPSLLLELAEALEDLAVPESYDVLEFVDNVEPEAPPYGESRWTCDEEAPQDSGRWP